MNPLTIRPDRLERLRTICLALPEATEKVAWGDPTWRVRNKIFTIRDSYRLIAPKRLTADWGAK